MRSGAKWSEASVASERDGAERSESHGRSTHDKKATLTKRPRSALTRGCGVHWGQHWALSQNLIVWRPEMAKKGPKMAKMTKKVGLEAMLCLRAIEF